jgi:hypothetical protein
MSETLDTEYVSKALRPASLSEQCTLPAYNLWAVALAIVSLLGFSG